MTERQSNSDDQDQVNRAFSLINPLVNSHPEISVHIWVSTCINIVIETFLHNGIPPDKFELELQRIRAMYAEKWGKR